VWPAEPVGAQDDDRSVIARTFPDDHPDTDSSAEAAPVRAEPEAARLRFAAPVPRVVQHWGAPDRTASKDGFATAVAPEDGLTAPMPSVPVMSRVSTRVVRQRRNGASGLEGE
jgi:hypothetical protein